MSRHPNLIGSRFGKLVVTGQAESDASGHRRWLCQCDCGGTTTTSTGNLTCGHTLSCGCNRSRDLTGRRFGKLSVVERSDRYSIRGERKCRLWMCRCDCGRITYVSTDSLTASGERSCLACAAKYNSAKARAGAGYVDGTQLSRIRNMKPGAANTSGARGVYYDKKQNRWRARLKFKGKIMNFGSYDKFEDAVAARKAAEREYFGEFLEKHDPGSTATQETAEQEDSAKL